MIHDAFKLIRSGGVRRWHQNPDMNGCGENLAEHQWSVAMLVLIMEPEASRELLIAALTHDVAEIDVGDLAFTSGQVPGHREAEALAFERIMEPQELTEHERILLRCADRLAGWIKMMQWAPRLASRDDWLDMLEHTLHNLPRQNHGPIKKLMVETYFGS